MTLIIRGAMFELVDVRDIDVDCASSFERCHSVFQESHDDGFLLGRQQLPRLD